MLVQNEQVFSLKCEQHKNQTISICLEEYCGIKYLCRICIEQNFQKSSCLVNNHKIHDVNKTLLDKFNKSFLYNYKKIHELLVDAEKEDIQMIKSNFSALKNEILLKNNEKFEKFKEKVKEKLNERLNKINEKFDDVLSKGFNLNNETEKIIQSKMPESIGFDEIKKIFELAIQSNRLYSIEFLNEIEGIVNIIKKYTDKEKIKTIYNDLISLVYLKFVTDRSEATSSEVSDRVNILIEVIKSEMKTFKNKAIPSKVSSIVKNNKSILFESDPIKLTTKIQITDKVQKSYTIDSVFTAFTTSDDKSFAAVANQTYLIDVYSFNSELAFEFLQSLKSHAQHVFTIRHFYDCRNNSDYLLSTSYDKTVILWKYNLNKGIFDLLQVIDTGHGGLYIYSGLVLFDNTDTQSESLPEKSTYILSSVPNEQIRIFSITGELLKSIGNKTDYTYYINLYFDMKLNEYFIINANSIDVKIISFKEGNTIKAFKDTVNAWHMSAFICEIEKRTLLFESDGNGYLRIWDYNTVSIYKKLHAPGCNLRGILLWNQKFVIAASSDKCFKIFNIDEEKVFSSPSLHSNVLCTVQKITHPIYGESLMTSSIDGLLKLSYYENHNQ